MWEMDYFKMCVYLLFYSKINEAQAEVSSSFWFRTSLEKITANLPQVPENIVCFGIGRFSECKISRFQLGFLLNLQAEYRVRSITFHEPSLSKGEIAILERLGLEVFAENVEGKFKVPPESPTLIFSPHCPKQLTNNLLWANWAPNLLTNIYLICNSFDHLFDSTPQRFLQLDANYILRIRPFAKEWSFVNTFRYSDVFNDTSLHTFPELPAEDKELWTPKDEPDYSSGATELITKQLESVSLL